MKQANNYLSCIQREDKSYSFLNKILQSEHNIPNKSMQPKKILKLHKKYFSFKSDKDFETRVRNLKNLEVPEIPSRKAANKEREHTDDYNNLINSIKENTTGNRLNSEKNFMNFGKRKASEIKFATYNKIGMNRAARGAKSSTDLLQVIQDYTKNFNNDRINSTSLAGREKSQTLRSIYENEFNQQEDVDNKYESLNINKSRKIKEKKDDHHKIKSEENFEESLNLFKRTKNLYKRNKKEDNKNTEFKFEINPQTRKENPKKLNYINKSVIELNDKKEGKKILQKLRELWEKTESSSEIYNRRKNQDAVEESLLEKPILKRNSHQMLSNLMRRICIQNEVSLNKTTCENTEKNYLNYNKNIINYNNNFSNCDSDEGNREQESINQSVIRKSYFEYKLPTIISHIPTENSCDMKFPVVEFPNKENTKKKNLSNKLLTDQEKITTSFNQENERTNKSNNNIMLNINSIVKLTKSNHHMTIPNLYIQKQENFSFVPFEKKSKKKIYNLKINSDLKINERDLEKEKEFSRLSYVKSINLNASSDYILNKTIQPEMRNQTLKYDKLEKIFGDTSNFATNLEKFTIEDQKHKDEKKANKKKKNFFTMCFC